MAKAPTKKKSMPPWLMDKEEMKEKMPVGKKPPMKKKGK